MMSPLLEHLSRWMINLCFEGENNKFEKLDQGVRSDLSIGFNSSLSVTSFLEESGDNAMEMFDGNKKSEMVQDLESPVVPSESSKDFSKYPMFY